MPTLTPSGHLSLSKSAALLPYQDRPLVAREYMTETEIRDNIGSDLFLDVECYPNYFMCGFKHNTLNKFICLENDFNPQFLSWLLFNYRTIGFNSITYDLLMLWASYVNRDPRWLKNISNTIIPQTEEERKHRIPTKELEKQFNFKIFKTPHIDLFNVCPGKGSLKLYGARLHSPRIQDLPFEHTKELSNHEIDIVRNYNFNDLDNTQLVYNFNKDRMDLRASMGAEYSEDLMSKSDAQIAEVVIAKEVGKVLGYRIQRPEIAAGTTYKYQTPSYIQFASDELKELLRKVEAAEFRVGGSGTIELPTELDTKVQIGKNSYSFGLGGLHSNEKTVAYRTTETHLLVDRDVVSYYPRIITTLELCPVAMGRAFLEVFESIIKRRLHAKEYKIFATDKGLKIVINGTSGKLSDYWSKMYSPGLTMQMTITGQLALLMQIEMMHYNGIEAISANTDGVVYYCPRDKYELFNKWIKFWENETQFVTEETLYSGYFASDVNNYYAIKSEATSIKSVKVKGRFSEVGSQTGTQLDNNPIRLICSDAIMNLLVHGTPIEDTIRNCKDLTRFVTVRQAKAPGAHKDGVYLGKVLRWIYCKDIVGTINYVGSGNKIPETEGALPLQDLPETFPENLDYDKYIELTKTILIDIGYASKPKQIEFF